MSKKTKQPSNQSGQQSDKTDQHSQRFSAFERLAMQNAKELGLMLPSMLKGQARREHVRACLLEDHAERIDDQAQGTGEKFAQLYDSRFSFFRGSALLFYRDMAGVDADLPKVLLLGDVHPENFGVMPNRDGVPIFSVNDFDEVAYGPFSWDLRRGATGFVVAAGQVAGFSKKKRKKIAKKFIKGYQKGLKRYAKYNTEADDVFRMDNSPPLIVDLFEDCMQTREEWLTSRYTNETGTGFRTSKELTPVSGRVDEFQKLIDQVAKRNKIEPGDLRGSLKVKDVCIRHGQGTASLGLGRYYVLLEGPVEGESDDLIIEFKRARRSAMQGLMGKEEGELRDHAKRIAEGQRTHIPNGDAFYGHVTIQGQSFMSRERAPFRDDIDLDDLDYDQWKTYAKICGHALALAHARSDEAGEIERDVEPAILEVMQPLKLFRDDMVCHAMESAKRLKHDHLSYRRDYELGCYAALTSQL